MIVGDLIFVAFSTIGCGYFAPFDAPLPPLGGAGGRSSTRGGTSSNGAVAGNTSALSGTVSTVPTANGSAGSGTTTAVNGGAAGSITASSRVDTTSNDGVATGGTGSDLLGGAAQGGAAQGGAAQGGVAKGGVAGANTVATGGLSASGGTAATGGTSATGGATVEEPPSCRGLATLCQGESCCTTIKVPGGTFKMGRSIVEGASDYFPTGNADELPEHEATVDEFALDKYEVTVGRFRKFVENYDAWRTAGNPKDNAGMHPRATYTGWGRSWRTSSDELPADATALVASTNAEYGSKTSTYVDGDSDAYPLNWVNWFTAFAFCVWDDGRLATEAEWEYAAAGGSENRLYPWGNEEPDASRANYSGSDQSPFVIVGSKGERGAGRWGHRDLAGSMLEWVFDWHLATFYGTAESPARCDNCANSAESATSFGRVVRGAGWTVYGYADHLRATWRTWSPPLEGHDYATGIRCARLP